MTEVDLISLAIKIDASSADPAAAKMDNFAGASGRAEAGASKAGGAAAAMAAKFRESASPVAQLEARIDSLMASVDPLYTAQKRLDGELREAAALYKLGAIGASDYARAMRVLEERQGQVLRGQGMFNSGLDDGVKGSKALQQATLNMGRQASDVFVQLGSGASIWLVALQQGPQIFDGLQVAAMQTGTTVKGAMMAMGASIWTAMAPLIPLMAGIAVAAAAIAAPFAIAAYEINRENKGLINDLGLTAEQIKRVGNTSVTMGDTMTGAWVSASKALTKYFGPEIESLQKWFADAGEFIVGKMVAVSRTVVGALVGGVYAIGAAWRGLPAVLGDAAITAANAVIGAVEGMINGGIRAINKLLPAVNALQIAMPGPDVLFPAFSEVSINRMANQSQGAVRALWADISGEFRRGQAQVDSMSREAWANWERESRAAYERRVRREAGSAGPVGGGAATDQARREVQEVITFLAEANRQVSELNLHIPEMLDPLEMMVRDLRLIDDLSRNAGRGLADSFGEAGKAIAGITDALSGYRLRLAEIDLAEREFRLSGTQAARERTDAEVQSYGDMAGAAKSFFGEKTVAFKALQGVEMAYRALQFANSVRAMALDATETGSSIGNSLARGAAKAAEGVADIFAKLGPWGFPVAAAALAVMASVGVRVAGGGGSSGVPVLPTTNSGTGTVSGDQGAQSASIGNSIDLAERYWNKDLDFSNKSLTALKAIQTNIGSLTNAIAREMNVGGGLDPTGLNQGPTTSGGFLGAFSTTRSSELVGSGINLSGGALSDLIARGVSGGLYQIVQTTSRNSGFFGIGASTRTTNNETSTALDGGLSREFSRVLASLRDGVLTAAGDLGLTGAEAVLDAFQVNLGRISFDGMSSSEISETLNAVFSAVGDDMARAILPGLDAFQRAGEGMLETLSRLATEYRTVDVTLQSIGMTFGTVGLASVEARTRLVELSGGLDAFTEGASFFAENFLTDAQRIAPIQAAVTAELTRLGVASDISRSGFASLVMGLDVSTEAGSSMFAALMRLAPALDQVISYTDDLTGAVVDAIDLSRQRRSLEIALMEAQGNSSAALAARRADELAAMDASLRPLQELIWTTNDIAEAARLATAAQEEAARAAQAIADQRRSMEITLMELTGDASGALAARRAIELSGMDASLQALQRLIYAQTDLNAVNEAAATAANEAAQAAIEREQLLAQYRAQAETDALALVEKARDALSAAYEREAGAIQTTIDKFRGFEEGLRRFRESLGLEGLTPGASLAVSKADFERTSALARVGNEQALGDLQGVSEAYLEQSRAYSKTSLDHLRNLSSVREAVQAAEATAGRQASIGEQQLAALNGSVEGLMVLNGSVLSVRDAISALASAQAVLSSVTPAVANDNREWGVNPEVNRLLARQTGYAGDFGSGGFDAWIRTQDEAVKAGARATLAAQGQAYRIGFATGGSFEVGGSGGTDSTPISFMATPGEMVNIRRPGDNDNGEMRALREEVAELKRAMMQVVVNTGMTARATKSTDDNIDRIANGEQPISTVAA